LAVWDSEVKCTDVCLIVVHRGIFDHPTRGGFAWSDGYDVRELASSISYPDAFVMFIVKRDE
jgi:hypothetical protein